MLTFDRPIGAHGDVAELEYISALMQTGDGLRSNGSLDCQDICLYLKSRHGIIVDEATAQQLLMYELAGQTADEKPESLDLCQFASILLIPYLVQATKNRNDDAFSFFVRSIQRKESTDVFTREQLRIVFDSFADLDVSDQLLDDMIKVSGADSTGQGGSMVQALVGDVLDFDCDWKDSRTTNYHDALRAGEPKTQRDDDEEEPDPEATHDFSLHLMEKTNGDYSKQQVNPLARIYTAASVDYSAETYRRPLFVMTLWVCGVALYFAYVFQTGEGEWSTVECGEGIGCSLLNGVTKWLAIFVQLGTLGLAFIFFSSLGSSVYVMRKMATLTMMSVGMAVVALFSVVPYFVGTTNKFFYTYGNKLDYDGSENDIFGASYYISFALGLCLLMTQFVDFCSVLISKSWLKDRRWLQSLVMPANVKNEAGIKQAAEYKINSMVANAMVFQPEGSVSSSESSSLLAAMNFQLHEIQTERIGGFLWAWKKIFNGTIVTQEGVWLHSRLWTCNFAQLTIAAFIIFFAYLGYANIDTLVKASTALTDKVVNGTDDYAADDVLQLAVERLDFNPFSFNLAVTIGLITGLATVLYVTVVYVPSHVSTVLKFRCGEIKSLRDHDFSMYRRSMDVATVLFGSAFWGTLFAAVATALFFGGIVVAVSKARGNFGPVIGGWMLGFVVVLLMKQGILFAVRFSFFKSFYRRKPAGANIFFIVMECWNVGLSVGFILIRFITILVISIFYVARIDTPFLAPGVGRFGQVELDRYPRAFRKDALMHDAHRHAYIERFGLLCLLKLRLGDRFACRPHSCWRLLYTLSLMPWLRKYRVGISSDEEIEDRIEVLENEAVENKEGQVVALAEIAALEISKNTGILDSKESALEAEVGKLKSKNRKLKRRNKYLKEDKEDLARQLKEALERNAQLEQQLGLSATSDSYSR